MLFLNLLQILKAFLNCIYLQNEADHYSPHISLSVNYHDFGKDMEASYRCLLRGF